MLTSMAAVAPSSKRSVHLNKTQPQRNHKTCTPVQAPTTCINPPLSTDISARIPQIAPLGESRSISARLAMTAVGG